ncbi:unnamed protein product [Vitrella brassicaformis CCMP3155]|uniref:K Homology domain-containing protein n=1 Tax=Vitrella brassicaformis (strain CCMP3155) TaxID=1169540 RepID=A0A0G4FMX5_VITBC|nr:unnamed protein product [Vitrella brassicaformis CCMP3155]|eukprot:CEM15534.1 unnamed protein product [Vitrella brassicaformis CCMP3155]
MQAADSGQVRILAPLAAGGSGISTLERAAEVEGGGVGVGVGAGAGVDVGGGVRASGRELVEVWTECRVPAGLVGRIIGKGGGTIKEIENQSTTKVNIIKEVPPSTGPHRMLTIRGSLAGVKHAHRLIEARIKAPAVVVGTWKPPDADKEPVQFEKPPMPDWVEEAEKGEVQVRIQDREPDMPIHQRAPDSEDPDSQPAPLLEKDRRYEEARKKIFGKDEEPDVEDDRIRVDVAIGAYILYPWTYLLDTLTLSHVTQSRPQPSTPPSQRAAAPTTPAPTPGQGRAPIPLDHQHHFHQQPRHEEFNEEVDCVVVTDFVVPAAVVGRIIGCGGQAVRETQQISGTKIQMTVARQLIEAKIKSPILEVATYRPAAFLEDEPRPPDAAQAGRRRDGEEPVRTDKPIEERLEHYDETRRKIFGRCLSVDVEAAERSIRHHIPMQTVSKRHPHPYPHPHQQQQQQQHSPPPALRSPAEVTDNETVVRECVVPAGLVGRIIGRQGRTVRDIERRSATSVHIISEGPLSTAPYRTVTIKGPLAAVKDAQELIERRISGRLAVVGTWKPPEEEALTFDKPAMPEWVDDAEKGLLQVRLQVRDHDEPTDRRARPPR